MSAPGFVHLHVHSNYSFLDGASGVEDLVDLAHDLGMTALALTDHDGLYGAVKFVASAKALGIKPLIGAEVTVDGYHLVLLARNRPGYSELCRLISEAHLSDRDNPVVSLKSLATCRNLFALSACGRGEITSLIIKNRPDDALAAARKYRDAVGQENFWVELQHHLLQGDDWLNAERCRIASLAGLGCVATNNVHYARPDGYQLQDVLTCIRTITRVSDHHPERKLNSEYYLKSPEEMWQLLGRYPEALEATVRIAAECDVDLSATHCRPPAYDLPAGETPFSYLLELCMKGARKRYRPLAPPVLRQLAHELTIIEGLDLAEFFLCVWDITHFSGRNGIRYAGRGSAADSLVAYCLGITAVDPLAHKLLFERFLNPERRGMPDIDVDFDSRRRDEVISYVENKYTERHAAMVANVITYRVRSAVRDVAKALGFPLGEIDRMSKLIHRIDDRDLRKHLEDAFPEKKGTESMEMLISLCGQLDGFPRHLGLHNGGMLLTREPLIEIVPVQYSANGVRVCQFNKDDVEYLGLIKFDILGLRNFSIISEALDLIEEARGERLDIDNIHLDDAATFDLLRSTRTIGVFQVESPGQWNLLSRTKPENVDDLVVQVALFRPGPLQGEMVNPYVQRRQGVEPVIYAHPCLEDVLKDTLGVILFQEQVLEIAHVYAGLSYADADGFRRAISHYRVRGEMEAMKRQFLDGADAMGRPRDVSEKMFDQLSAYTGYGFCKSHAAAFAKTVYQTAYLKAHYPAEFMAAILSNEPCDFYPPHVMLEEARHFGAESLPVDINRSGYRFQVENGNIRIGLMQVKGMSEEAGRQIVEAKKQAPFKSLEDFYRRTGVERPVIENLIKVGAFDAFSRQSRRTLLWQLQEVVNALGDRRGERRVELPLRIPVAPARLVPQLPLMTDLEKATTDFEVQGMSARYHMMQFHRARMQTLKVRQAAELRDGEVDRVVRAAGVVISRQRPPTAKGMLFLVLADETGQVAVAAYPKVYERYRDVVNSGSILIVDGVLQTAGYVPSIIARRFSLVDSS